MPLLKQYIITPLIIHMFEPIYIILVDIMDPYCHTVTPLRLRCSPGKAAVDLGQGTCYNGKRLV